MSIIERAVTFRRNWIDQFPGFWLNCLGLLLAAGVIFVHSYQEESRLERRILAAKSSTIECISSYLTKSLSLDRAEDHLRRDLAFVVLDKPEEFILASSGRPSPLASEYQAVLNLLDSLHLRQLIILSSLDGIENSGTLIAENIEMWIKERSLLLKNRKIHFVWTLTALLYVVIVAFAYFRSSLNPERGEPILNIIDLGLYLTLIEYSGGLASPILIILALSVTTACLDFFRVYNLTGGLSPSTIRIYGLREIFGRYAPTVLYIFSLVSGLLWASLDHAVSEKIRPTIYAQSYLYALLKLTLVGFFCLIVILLLHRLVRQVDKTFVAEIAID